MGHFFRTTTHRPTIIGGATIRATWMGQHGAPSRGELDNAVAARDASNTAPWFLRFSKKRIPDGSEGGGEA
jgi:hypothetical protein